MSDHTGSVKAVFDELPKDHNVLAIIRCGDKTERYPVKKTDPKPLIVTDNEMTFEGTTLELNLQTKKSFIKVRRPNKPIELALHTPTGRAYVSTEDGINYKSSAEGSVKITKASRGQIAIKSGSDICAIL